MGGAINRKENKYLTRDINIHQLNSCDQPRSRLANNGVESLAEYELLAIVLRSGGVNNSALTLAKRLIVTYKGLRGVLNANFLELTKTKDIGVAKAASIKAISEITRRVNLGLEEQTIVIKRPQDVYRLMLKEIANKEKEYLYLISLTVRNRLIAKDLISIGTTTETLVDPKEVLRTALSNNATSIILVHNHPSGDPTPSLEDVGLTEKLNCATKQIGIFLIDHVIIGKTTFNSMKASKLFNA